MTMEKIDVVIVGAGFAGISAVYKFKQQGLKAVVFEAGSGVGGTWHFNKYPGARCDTHSMEYSFQFSEELQQDWEWSEKYATQPEILEYLNHTVDRFNLRKDIRLNTRVEKSIWNQSDSIWEVSISSGELFLADYLVMATGCLSKPNFPNINGIDTFSGEVFHTSRWPEIKPDFTSKTVGIIGTGSSGIQCIPIIASEAKRLIVYQRTPNYSVPARNEGLSQDFVANIKSRYRLFREDNYKQGFGLNLPLNDVSALDVSEEERTKVFERQWKKGGLGFLTSFNDLLFNMESNYHAQQFIRNKIKTLVKDPVVAEKLMPRTPLACKRLCVDTGYYETFNRKNVELVDIKTNPIDLIKSNSVIVGNKEHVLDTLIIATGFDAMTGALTNIEVIGKGGVSIKDKWKTGPSAYLGIAISGFPNLFMITGPGSPSVLSNMVPSIEQHVNWISDCIEYLRNKNFTSIEADLNAQKSWMEELNEISDQTIYPHCQSWYLGTNIKGKKQAFTAYLGVPPYIDRCKEVVESGYEGFSLSK